MSTIGELIANIQQYGNSKYYLKALSNHRAHEVLEFLVNEKEKLTISRNLEVVNEECQNTESIEIVKYAEEDLTMVIATIVFHSFLTDTTMLTHKETSTKPNTDAVVKNIYNIVYAMMQLSNADLTRWVLLNNNGRQEMLIDKASQNITSKEINLEQAVENIEAMREKVYNRLNMVKDTWHKTQIMGSKEEFEIACKQWDSLYDDHVIPKVFTTEYKR